MRRFDWDEMQQYWQEHASARVDVDFDRDPDGLGNVCYVGAPLWWNRQHARSQFQVFEQLLSEAKISGTTKQALDVGCGTGRWSQYLTKQGFQVVGVDLQPSLITRNQARFPGIKFHCTSLQDFDTTDLFDLVSSVTVIQHVPHLEQINLVTRIAELLRPGGYALILENISDQAPHVFSRSTAGWISLFKDHGLDLVDSLAYDYNPATRFLAKVGKRVRGNESLARADYNKPAADSTGGRDVRRQAVGVAKRVCGLADAQLEKRMITHQVRLPAGHSGFLFTKTASPS